VLIILSSVGYFFYARDKHTLKSANEEPFPVGTVREGQGMEKGENPFLLAITKARLQLDSVDNIDRVRVIIEEDRDAKRSVRHRYEWFKNNKPFGTNDNNVAGFTKGDKIDVRITPFDSERYGQPVYLSIEIARVPPKIVENRTIGFDGDALSYQIKAVDPDGGTLSYSLVSAPKDMTIDSGTGVINWHVKPGDHGKHEVHVMIKNSSGAEIIYPLSIDIGKPNG
jgi:hypothetical protein